MPLNTSFPFPTVHAAPLRSPLHSPSPSSAWLQPEWTTKLETSGFSILILWFFFKAVWPEVAAFKHLCQPCFAIFFLPKGFSSSLGFKLREKEKGKWKRIKRRERPYLFLSCSSSYHLENVLELAECMSLGFAWGMKGVAAVEIPT